MIKQRPYLSCVGFLGVSFLIVGILVSALFDSIINPFIYKELLLENGTSVFKDWLNPPITPHLRIYFFNLTNREEFLRGSKAQFAELGPYCYREEWKRVNVSLNNNGTVTYEMQKFYHFVREHSSGSEQDRVVTANVPLITAVYHVRLAANLVKLALSSMLQVLNETAFVERSVKELVWGYEDPLLKIAKDVLPPEQRLPSDKFGFFLDRNASADGVINAYTGSSGMTNYTMINSVDYNSTLTIWNGTQCNRITGSDGTSFPPSVRRYSTLYVYNKNFCRSMPLVYWHDMEKFGIKGYRFTPPNNVYGTVEENPENKCFCLGGPPCLGGGVFNVSACQFGAPIIYSWPHFYQAHEKYREAVNGLSPDSEKHAFYVDVAPRTGTPLEAQARLQINIAMHNETRIKAVKHLQKLIFPICWFEDGVMDLPDRVVKLLQKASNLPEVYKTSFEVAFYTIGCILVLGVLIVFLFLYWKLPVPFFKSMDAMTPNSSRAALQGHVNPAMSAEPEKDAP